jgi:hypothetical protein
MVKALSMTIFAQLCSAPLRNKLGQTCRAFALRDSPWGRCRIHAGRPPASGSPEGRAATAAGHAAYVAKTRARIARGELKRFPGGRRKKWIIPRWWRYRLDEIQEATVLRAMLEHDARAGIERPPWPPITSKTIEARAFAQFERSFILRLNDCSSPLPEDKMEQFYADLREGEEILSLPGSDVRLKRLAWERHQFLLRALTRDRLRPGAARYESPVMPAAPSPHETSNRGSPCQPANDLAMESEAERKNRDLQAAYEHSMAIVAAGKATGERRRQLEIDQLGGIMTRDDSRVMVQQRGDQACWRPIGRLTD